jgi:hypothetical protein
MALPRAAQYRPAPAFRVSTRRARYARDAMRAPAYFNELAFRHKRHRTNGVGRIAARVIEPLIARQPLTMRSPIDDTRRYRQFGSGSSSYLG